jgi:ribosomal protein L11 methyltransferase
VAEPRLVRWSVAVPVADAEVAAALLLDAFPAGLEEESGPAATTLSGYLPPGEAPRLPPGLEATAEPVAPGWLDGWRAFHRPVELGPFWIGPPWDERPPGLRHIVIDPGAAFGTGAHGSTRAAAALLMRARPGGPLVDIGCGSGVLAILGAMLGFGPVVALDIDPLAVEAARANAAANGVEIDVRLKDACRDDLPPAPLAVANLQLDLLGRLFTRPVLAPALIVSGLLDAEHFAPAGYVPTDAERCDGWQALRLERAS